MQNLGNRALFEERLARQGSGRGVLFVVQSGDTPVGFGYLWLEEAEERKIREHLEGVPLLVGLEVVEDQRNKGFGTQLISAMEKYATDAGYNHVALGVVVPENDGALGVLPENDGAARLYRRLGYHDWEHGLVYSDKLVEDADGQLVRVANAELIDVLVKNLEPTPHSGSAH